MDMTNINLNYEQNRLNTFNVTWPHWFISPRIWAKTGFHYIGPYDNVKCHFCKVEISHWEMGGNEVFEHNRWSPNCSLLKRGETANVPIEPTSELDRLLPSTSFSYDSCGAYSSDPRPDAYAETPFMTEHAVKKVFVGGDTLITMSVNIFSQRTEPVKSKPLIKNR